MRRSIAATLSALVLMEALLAPSAQASLWTDRARARISAPSPTLLAALPAIAVSPGAAAPFASAVLPADAFRFGSVRRAAAGRGTAGTIILVQDIHRHAEAQKNISSFIAALAREGKADLVALEGAFGPVDLSRFAAYPDKSTIAAVADYLRDDGALSGAAEALITLGPSAPEGVGVDDATSYAANVAAYRAGASIAVRETARIASARARLAADKAAFNPALAAFDSLVGDYRAARRSLSDYAAALDGGRATPHIALFLAAAKLEKAMGAAEVERQRARLLERLTGKLSRAGNEALLADAVAFRLGRLSLSAFIAALEQRCLSAGIALSDFPQMEIYARAAELADRLDADALFQEMALRETAVFAALARTRRERDAIAEDRRLNQEARLVAFSLSSPEWDAYRRENPRGRSGLAPFEDFYHHADARSAAMTANVLRAVRGKGNRTVALVAGGFHADAVARDLRAAGFATVAWAPRVGRADPSQGAAYLTAFAQERTPLEKIFEGRRLFVTPDPFAGLVAFPALAVGLEEARDPNNDAAGDQRAFDALAAGLPARVHAEDVPGGARVDIDTDDASVRVDVRTSGAAAEARVVSAAHRWTAPALRLIPSVWGRLIPILMVRGWTDRQIAALGGAEELVFGAVLVSGLSWLLGATLGVEPLTALIVSSIVSLIAFSAVHLRSVYRWNEGFLLRAPPTAGDAFQILMLGLVTRSLYAAMIFLPIGGYAVPFAILAAAYVHAFYNSIVAPLIDGTVGMAAPSRRDGQLIASPWITDPEVTISHATGMDYANIAEIRRNNLVPDRDPGFGAGDRAEADLRENFHAITRGRRHGSFLVLKRAGRVIGYAYAQQTAPTTAAFIEGAVDDIERGHGFGRALFAERLRLLLEDVRDVNTITVSDGNPMSITTRNAIHFGFSETGVRRLSLHLTPPLRAELLRRLAGPGAVGVSGTRDAAIITLNHFYNDRYLNASEAEMYDFPFLADFRWTLSNDGEDLGYFTPTPVMDAAILLRAVELRPGMIMIDAGGGDARVAMTASVLGANALSIEADPRLHEMALRMRDDWTPHPGDGSLSLMNIPVQRYDLSAADVVYYTYNEPRAEAVDHDNDDVPLGPDRNLKTMERQLAAQLKPGAVVVLTFAPETFTDPSLEPLTLPLSGLVHSDLLRPRFYRKRAPGVVEIAGPRRAVVTYEADFMSQLDAANPGLRAKVERMLSTPFADLQAETDYDRLSGGRSAIIYLENPVEVDGRLIAVVKVKGTRFESPDSEFDILELHRQHGARIPRGLKVSKPTITKEGRFEEQNMPPIPQGGSRLDIAQGELDMTRELHAAGFLSALPLASARFPDHPAVDGGATGAIVLGLEGDLPTTAEMITQVAQESGMDHFNAARAPDLRQRTFIRFMREMIVRQGRALRDLNDAGFTHYQFHLDNSSVFPDGVFYHDLEGATIRSASTEAEFLGNALYGMRNAIGAIGKLANSPLYGALGLNYVELFIDGYFYDLEPDERPWVERPDLDVFFLDAREKPVTRVDYPLARAMARVLNVEQDAPLPRVVSPLVTFTVSAPADAPAFLATVVAHFAGRDALSFADLETGSGAFVGKLRGLLGQAFATVDGIGAESHVAYVRAPNDVVIADPQDAGAYEAVGLTARSRDIVTINAIEPTLKVPALIAEAARLVRPDGLIVITFERYDIGLGDRVDLQVRGLLERNGFTVDEQALASDYPTSDVFEQNPDLMFIARRASVPREDDTTPPEERLAAAVTDAAAAIERGASAAGEAAAAINATLAGGQIFHGVDTLDGRASELAGAVAGEKIDEAAYVAALRRRFRERFGALEETGVHGRLWSALVAASAASTLADALEEAADPKSVSVVIVTESMRAALPRLVASLPSGAPVIFVAETVSIESDVRRAAGPRATVVTGGRAFSGRADDRSRRLDLPMLEAVMSKELGQAYLAGLPGVNVIAPSDLPLIGAGRTGLFRDALFLLIDEFLRAAMVSRPALDTIETLARLVSSQA